MASKTTRKKFRPPLKAPPVSKGSSLPCSQASGSTTCTAVGAEASQGKGRSGKESSQSWLSQLSAGDCAGTANLPASEANTGPTTCPRTEVGLQLDDSLSSDISHGRNGGESVEQSPAAGLQGTQTHTVLSYCSEANAEESGLQNKSAVAAQQDRFQVSDFPESRGTESTVEYTTNHGSTDGFVSSLAPRTKFLLASDKSGSSSRFESDGFVSNLDTPYSAEEEMEVEMTEKEPSRFQRKNKPAAHRYNYGNTLPKLGPKRVANKKNKSQTKKHVSLFVNQNHLPAVGCGGAAEESVMSKGDLSVYDYQPTPQQEESGPVSHMEGEDSAELNNSRISKRTREEQVSCESGLICTEEYRKFNTTVGWVGIELCI